jgi:transcriptional regulator with XRE-family HTH domain
MRYSDVIVKRLTELCEQRNITRSKLATLAGLNPATVRSIFLTGNVAPRLDTLHKIAIGLDMTLPELLDFPELHEAIFDEE